MKVTGLLLLLTLITFGQSNMYWQNGYFPKYVNVVYSESKTKHYYIASGKGIQLTEDNFKTSHNVGSHAVSNWEGLICKEYAIFLSTANHLERYNLNTGITDDLGESSAAIFLKYSEDLLYYQDDEGDIYCSNDKGVSWQFVKNSYKINSWGSCGEGYIYCSDNNHDIYRVDSLFENKTVIMQNAGLRYRDQFYTAGRDTVFFLSDSKLYRSFDRGNSFLIQDFGNSEHGIKADKYGDLYILLKNRLIKSTDKGENWEEILYKGDNHGFFYIFENTIHLIYGNDDRQLYHDPDISSPVFSNFFPLEVGNKWFYLSTNDWYGYKTIEVYDSVIIGGEKYFRVTGYDYPLKYEDNKLTFNRNGHDFIYLDFNIPSGQRAYYWAHNHDYSMHEGQVEIFDSSMYYKGPFFSAGIERSGAFYTPGIGKVSSSYYEIIGATYIQNYDTLLVQALIKSPSGIQQYNDMPPPVFSRSVDVFFEENAFKIQTKVNHEMSLITGYINVDMIESVILDYFYSNGSSSVSGGNVTGIRQNGSTIYTFTGPLENYLLQSGYSLNIKFTARSKGIIPVVKQYPESGYIVLYGSTVGVENNNSKFTFFLENNYPNPFNPTTEINYSLAKSSFVVLEVFNIQGERVSLLVNENQSAGEHNLNFDGSSLASGVYIARLRATSTENDVFIKSIKMILLK